VPRITWRPSPDFGKRSRTYHRADELGLNAGRRFDQDSESISCEISPEHGAINQPQKSPAETGPEPSENAALCQRAGPGEGSVAALSTARSISSTVMSGVMLTRTTPVELPTSDMVVADTASG
jgi:hypothetical protein